jgi:S-layer protein
MRTDVTELYVSLFGRAPDAQGLGYWVNQIDTGVLTLSGVAQAMYNTDPARAYYPLFLTNSEFVTNVYTNVLGRAPDADGLAYWTGRVDSIGKAGVVLEMIDAVNNYAGSDPAGLTSKALFQNKVVVGEYYAEHTVDGVHNATAAISDVTATSDVSTSAAIEALIAAGGGAAGQTFTLTTGVDNFTGGAGNDTFNAILGGSATLNSFDSIAGGAGTDTLNLVDSSGASFAVPVSTTISGIDVVNLSRTGGTGGVTITDTTFGTGVTSLSLTDVAAASEAVSVTLNSATSVSAVETVAGKEFSSVAITDTSTTAASTGSTLTTVTVNGDAGTATLTGNGIKTVNLNNVAGKTTVTAAAATRALTVNTSGTADLGGLTDTTATTVTVNNSGKIALGSFTTAAATTFNYNSTAADTSATIVAAAATALNVGGSAVATLTIDATDKALATVTVTGTAGLTSTALNAGGALKLLDTTGTTGVVTAKIGNATAVNGGAGNDVITVGATTAAINLGSGINQVTLTNGTTALGTGGSINGGSGAANVLAFETAADAGTLSTAGATQTAFKAAVTGFEVLSLPALNGDLTVDAMGFGTFHTVNVLGAAHTLTVQNLASGDTVNVTGANTGVTTAGSTGSGINDVINFGLKNASAAITAFGTFTTPNVETVAFHMTDTQANPVGYLNTATLTDISVHSITVAGNSGLDLGTVTGATALTSFDASGVTGAGGVGITTAALQYASTFVGSSGTGSDTINASAALAAVTITDNATGTNTLTGASGTYVDTITAGNGNNSITTGGGADVITAGTGNNTIIAGAGNDTITVGSGTNSITGGAGADTITIKHGALANVDTIVIAAIGETGAGITASGVLTGVDVVSGLAKSDVINISAIAGTIGSVTHETAFSGAEIAGTGSTAFLVQGTYAASTGVFTASATGTDSVFMYDNNGSTAGGSMEAVVLVGYHGASAAAANGVVTLG